jgi:cysteine-rich repeat protein
VTNRRPAGSTTDSGPPCGNGHLDVGEECDDGNDIDDDICGNTCRIATCDDGRKNDAETDIDCGGAVCGPCADGLACAADSDCMSKVCIASVCKPASLATGEA